MRSKRPIKVHARARRSAEMVEHYTGHRRALAVTSYSPDGPTSGSTVVLLHGGGFVGGSIEDVAAPARALAERLELSVVTPEYTLATETPFPAAAEDAYAALQWTAERSRGVIVA